MSKPIQHVMTDQKFPLSLSFVPSFVCVCGGGRGITFLLKVCAFFRNGMPTEIAEAKQYAEEHYNERLQGPDASIW